jgi:hypothetical protein
MMEQEQLIAHRGHAWPPVTVHDPASVAALWHAVALRRMNDGDHAGAKRAIRTEVNLSWRPGWRSR